MKTLFIILFLITAYPSFSQVDSSNLKPSVMLQARDMEYLINFTGSDVKFRVIDSVFAKKLSGSNAPSGTTTVQCDSIKAKHWFALFEYERLDPLSIDQGIWGRFKTALNGASFTWLIGKIATSDANAQAAQSDFRSLGRKIARRELDNQ